MTGCMYQCINVLTKQMYQCIYDVRVYLEFVGKQLLFSRLQVPEYTVEVMPV